ncbi:MAG: sucrase ferredoxin [Actinomycetota bacterium]|nr:sucrase ferredoxin [Actinomycetota bacterium]
MIGNLRCTDAARERGDPLAATAVSAQRWLLIEHPGPWAHDAFGGAGILPDVCERIVAAVRATRTRLLMVRRHGRSIPSATRSWAVVDAQSGGVRWGSWQGDRELLAAADLLAGDVGAGAAPGPPAAPLLLVCTHGRHDTCCAVRGRPLAAALSTHWPESTWECSHVGGDRFAPNLVVLPDGTYYGNLDADVAVGVVEAHLAGAVSAAHLRGFAHQPPVVQAAVIAAHERFGPAGVRDAVCTRVEPMGDGAWRVHLVGSGSLPVTVEATVTRRRREAALLTCHAHQPSGAWSYHVEDLRAGTRRPTVE